MNRSALFLLAAVSALSAPALGSTQALAQYGPDTCRQGFVWREAFAGDHVCVRPWVRSQTAANNAAAPSRIYENGRCVDGLVWRESYPGDHVCVLPETRSRAARDNDRAPYRREY
jgi:hypothetical protein